MLVELENDVEGRDLLLDLAPLVDPSGTLEEQMAGTDISMLAAVE